MKKKTISNNIAHKKYEILSTLIVFTQTSKQRKRGDRQTDRLIHVHRKQMRYSKEKVKDSRDH